MTQTRRPPEPRGIPDFVAGARRRAADGYRVHPTVLNEVPPAGTWARAEASVPVPSMMHAQARRGFEFYTQTKVVIECWPATWSRTF